MRTGVLLLLLAAMACGPREKSPVDLLDRERFKEVLLQAQLIEARVDHELIVEQAVRVPAQRYYDELFAEQGITEEQFANTFAYYAARPEELKAIYEEIVTELNYRKDLPPQ